MGVLNAHEMCIPPHLLLFYAAVRGCQHSLSAIDRSINRRPTGLQLKLRVVTFLFAVCLSLYDTIIGHEIFFLKQTTQLTQGDGRE